LISPVKSSSRQNFLPELHLKPARLYDSGKGLFMAYDVELARRINAILKNKSGWVEKKMFGGVGFMLNGNMAVGVHKDNLIVRFPEAESDQALKLPNVTVFDMTGRPMKGWIMVKPVGLKNDRDLKKWVERGLDFASGLPKK
jgi:TfoX/Sxy family transcriptional regulator of competence genes